MNKLILLFLLIPINAHADVNDKLLNVSLGAFMAAEGADLSTTMYCIGNKTCRESNPIFAPFTTKPILAGSVKMGLSSFFAYALIKLHKQHPKLALTLSLIGTGVETWVSVHNSRLNK